MLYHESGIDPDVVEERGYYTARTSKEVPEEFADYQRRLLKGTGPLLACEGSKKADSGLSRGIPTIAFQGVWMSHIPKERKSDPKILLGDWDFVNLNRTVLLGFDSDWRRNECVYLAVKWLVGALEKRGAKEVLVAYLPDKPDGSKMGVDDFLARDGCEGGTLEDLLALCRPFEEQDIGAQRMRRDKSLWSLIEDLERTLLLGKWPGMGGASARDVYIMLIEAAKKRGKIHEDGIRVKKAQGPLALEAKISSRTLQKALGRLEEWGLIYRDNEGRKPDEKGAFVLRASVKYVGGTTIEQEQVMPLLQRYNPGTLLLRAPRLMWSRPASRPRRGLVEGTRKIHNDRPAPPRAAIKRLGKIRGAIIDMLDLAGGSLALEELAELLHRKRARDIRRRNLPMLEEEGIVVVEQDQGQGAVVRLTENWQEALEDARSLAGEIDRYEEYTDPEGTPHTRKVEGAETVNRRRYEIKSRALHSRNRHRRSKPTGAGWDAIRQSRAKRQQHTEQAAREAHERRGQRESAPPLSALARILRDCLEPHPGLATLTPHVLGFYLHADGLCQKRPTADQVRAAIEELGGERYLRTQANRARRKEQERREKEEHEQRRRKERKRKATEGTKPNSEAEANGQAGADTGRLFYLSETGEPTYHKA
jgi:DNA-binding HxlR family transcriptional regulator